MGDGQTSAWPEETRCKLVKLMCAIGLKKVQISCAQETQEMFLSYVCLCVSCAQQVAVVDCAQQVASRIHGGGRSNKHQKAHGQIYQSPCSSRGHTRQSLGDRAVTKLWALKKSAGQRAAELKKTAGRRQCAGLRVRQGGRCSDCHAA